MSVIERTCPGCGGVGTFPRDGLPPIVCATCDGDRKVVPIERYRRAVERAEKAELDLREFQAGLTDALRVHNVPAMPSWSEAIHWLARHGGS